MVIEEQLFIIRRGLEEEWGQHWRKVEAEDQQAATAIADKLLPSGPTPMGDPKILLALPEVKPPLLSDLLSACTTPIFPESRKSFADNLVAVANVLLAEGHAEMSRQVRDKAKQIRDAVEKTG